MPHTTADILVDRLIAWGVDTIFGYPGDGVNGIFEALRTRQSQIRFVQVRHEEAAAFAACGYAKFTGRLGVCLATSGPGGIHLLNGLYDAKCDGQPVLAITGHTFHDLIGTSYQQDVDLDRLFVDVAAYSERVMGPAHVISVVDTAIRHACSLRTVAHLTIPKDVQDWNAGDEPRSSANVPSHTSALLAPSDAQPSAPELRAAADLIDRGSKVAILAGRGCLGARQQVLALAERAAAPIVKALLGKAVVPDDSPLTTGGIGLLGTAPSQEVMSECDVLIIAGSSFPYLEFYPKPGRCRTIQIDTNPRRIGLRHPVDVGLIGDCGRVLGALTPMIRAKRDRAFLESAQASMVRWNELMEKRATRTDSPLKPQVVAHELNALLNDDAIVCCDTGTITTWAARHIRMRGTMQFSASGLLASMGNGLPYSVASAHAFPGRQVVCIAGDGGLTMMLGELATLVKYELPVKVVVFKNNVLGEIKWEQLVLEGNPQFGVELQPIDFAACARACGMAGFSVVDHADVAPTLRRAVEHKGPALVEAVVDPNEPPMPGKVTMEQAWHFVEALARGESSRSEIVRTVVKNTVREVI